VAGTTEPTSVTVGLRRGDGLPADSRAHRRRKKHAEHAGVLGLARRGNRSLGIAIGALKGSRPCSLKFAPMAPEAQSMNADRSGMRHFYRSGTTSPWRNRLFTSRIELVHLRGNRSGLWFVKEPRG